MRFRALATFPPTNVVTTDCLEREVAVNNELRPVVNGCYIDDGGDMYKVRLLCFEHGRISDIIAENTKNELFRWDLIDWYLMHLIPVCYTQGKQAAQVDENENKPGHRRF